ncbi:hypothetical protein ACROYT_G039299 [Oculina patagonica]
MEANRRIFLANHAESYTTRYLCIALFMSGMIDKKRKTRKDFQFSLYFKACTFNASVMIEFSHSHEVAVKINRINRLKPAVDGGWSNFGNWSECSVTCGDGQQERSRTCTNPPPSNGGAECSGSDKETKPCNNGPCTVDGGWSDFGDWSECSATCGGGIKERRRTCTSPPPSNGGACCVGDNVEAERCNTESCKEEIVYGGWSVWSAYGECKNQKGCGKGRKTRTRTCTNPPPSGGGRNCKGKPKQSKKCRLESCKE